MTDSLRVLLYNEVRKRGRLSYGDMCQFVAEEGYKVSTAERRLRGLMARKSEKGIPQVPEIRPIMAKSKRNTDYISAYEWIGTPVIPKVSVVLPPAYPPKVEQPLGLFA